MRGIRQLAGETTAKRHLGSVAVVIVAAMAWAAAAPANTVTISNPVSNPSTLVEGFNGSSPYATFGPGTWGSYWGADISRSPDVYQTTGATISWTGDVITMVFQTTFPSTGGQSGTDTSYPQPIYAADIFLKSGGSSTIPPADQFNYAIALGYTDNPSDNGAAKGVYSINGSDVVTAQDLWASRTAYAYGGLYASAANCTKGPMQGTGACTGAQQAPVVDTGGTTQADIGVNTLFGTGTMTVTLTATSPTGLSELDTIFGTNNSFDIFWGTGDCSNAPLWGDVTGLQRQVPEPGSIGLLASALLGFALLCRRRRLVTRL